jgi:hypothetical protein
MLGLCEDNCSYAPTECPKGMAYYGNLVRWVSCACCAARPPVLCDVLCLCVYCFVLRVVFVDGRETPPPALEPGRHTVGWLLHCIS